MTIHLARFFGLPDAYHLGFLLTVLVAGILGWLWRDMQARWEMNRYREKLWSGERLP